MLINEIYISAFGRLENKTFEFENGLNLIYGPNETGKTTIMDFIKFMFYGMKIHKNSGELSFKEKYMPWSGTPASGTLTLTCDDGTKYIISRQCSADRSSVSVLNALTGESNKNIDLKQIGKEFLGLNEDSFSYTSFLSNFSSLIKSDREGELVGRLENLSHTGDENISFTNAFGKIQEEIAILSSERRKNAIIPNLKNEISLLSDKIKILEDEVAEAPGVEKKIEFYKEKIAECQKKIENINENNDKTSLLKTHILKEITALKSSAFMKFENVSDSEKKTITSFNERSIKKSRKAAFLLFAFTLVFSGLFSIADEKILILKLFVVFILLFLGILKIRNVKYSKKASLILKKYLCNECKDFFEGIKIYENISAKINMLEDELSNLSDAKEGTIDSIKTKNISNDFTFCEFDGKIDSAKEDFEDLNRNLFISEQKLEMCRQSEIKLLDLKEEKHVLEEKLTTAQRRLKVLNLSCDILKKAHDDLKQEFAPQLSKYASEMLSEITSGKYGKVLTGDEFKVKLKSGFDFFDSRFFSRGTYEQIYFSMRLALLNIVVRDKNLPLFIDDAFGFYDNDRFINVLKLVYNESKKRQIFISSCRSEEYMFFRNQGVNVIELHSERND